MFVITEDCLEHKELFIFMIPGLNVNSDNGKNQMQKFMSGQRFKFRLLDDDGIVYFHGFSDDCDSERGFEPLDLYGQEYGCTEIQYRNDKGKWETL